MNNLHIKKGDTVMINSGADKGKKGKVLEVLPKNNKVVVEGINIRSKHTKPRKAGEAGGILNGAFLKEKLVDKLIQFTAPKILADNEGKSFAQGFDIKDINNSLYLKLIELKKFDEDIMCEYKILY